MLLSGIKQEHCHLNHSTYSQTHVKIEPPIIHKREEQYGIPIKNTSCPASSSTRNPIPFTKIPSSPFSQQQQQQSRKTVLTPPLPLPSRIMEVKRRHSVDNYTNEELEAKRRNKRRRRESLGYEPRTYNRHAHQERRQKEMLAYMHGIKEDLYDEDDIDVPRC